MPNSELYGQNAVTGSLEDARSEQLDGVEVRTSGSPTVFKVGEDQQPETQVEPPKAEETATPEQQLTQEAQAQLASDAEVAVTLENKGVDLGSLQTEFEATGSLSEATYTNLEKAGFPKNVVDAYIAGVEAVSERFTNAVYTAAGGAEQYARIGAYIGTLGKSHVDSFNKLIDTGDMVQVQVALQGYKAQMSAKYGTQNPTILGSAGGSSGAVAGFGSTKEMCDAINDPRYGREKKYTTEVRAKVAKTNF